MKIPFNYIILNTLIVIIVFMSFFKEVFGFLMESWYPILIYIYNFLFYSIIVFLYYYLIINRNKK